MQEIVKDDASGIGQETYRIQKPKDGVKYICFLAKRATKEGYNWITNNITICLFFAAVIYATILNVQLSKELGKKPCDKLLCYRENRKLKAEIQSFHQKIHNIRIALQMLKNYSNSLDKKLEDKHTEVKNEQYYSHNVQVLLVFIIAMIVVFIWMNRKHDIFTKTSEKTTKDLSKIPGVVYFSSHQLPVLMDLNKSFLSNREFSPILITKETDLPKINSKLVFLFVESNDRNIILESENETSQLKRRTVEAVENAGGKAVVIYQFHLESDKLEDGCLYSKKLTSIQRHSVLNKLSQEECVLTVYNNFSEYQKSHLKKLCKKYLAF